MLKPLQKYNNGIGATLCHQCRVVIAIGHTDDLFCAACRGKAHQRRIPPAAWRAMDWSKSNEELSHELRKNLTYVGMMRRKFAPAQHRINRVTWTEIDWSKSNAQIAREENYNANWVSSMRGKFSDQNKNNSN